MPWIFCWLVLSFVAFGLAPSAAGAINGSYLDWAAQVWGYDRTNSPVASEAADPDGDGIPNFLEYALGLDPTRPDTNRVPRWIASSSTREFSIQYEEPLAPRNAQVRLEWSGNIATPNWLMPDNQTLFDQLQETTAAVNRHQARFVGAGANPARFARLAAVEAATKPWPQGYIWFEAESPGMGDLDPRLSGGAMIWMNPGTTLEKTITIPTDGTYVLWVRKFWNLQTFRWRIGAAGAWHVAEDPPLQDLVELTPGNRVGWMRMGDAPLTAGTTSFELEVTDPSRITAYDCFLLTQEPFIPRGSLKPSEVTTAAQPGWFPFQPEFDRFGYSPIDLRWLNEKEAGEGGFIAARGEDFIHSNSGAPVRFWAVNVGVEMSQRTRSEIDLFARTAAKRGVNLVRMLHTIAEASGPNFGRIDTNQVAQTQYLVRALKREGIYASLDIYFPVWASLGPENTNFPGYTGQSPFALLYFNPAFQTLYRSWLDYLLTTPDPEIGVALKDEPALAMLEMVNEDSFFWWSFDPSDGNAGNVPDPQRATLEKMFGDWLLQKYPGLTFDQIRGQIWDGVSTLQDDHFAQGRVGFRPLWQMGNERTKRDQDTAQFLTQTQLAFYQDTYAYIKNTLHYKGMVSASNWATASDQYLGPLDKWSNSFADFMDRHGYYDSYHRGTNTDYAVEAGQTYDDRAAVKFQDEQGTNENYNIPLFDIIYNGEPSTISEVDWTPPNRLRADFPVLAAAYGALQGSDAIFLFMANSPAWDGTITKFSLQTPVVMGQFPATALIYRQGLVKTASKVVHLQLPVSNLFALQGTPLPAPQNFDQLRGQNVPPGTVLTNVSAIDSLAFTVGKVAVDFLTNGQPQSEITDLSLYIDRTNKIARSMTGELEWNWAVGIVKITAPAAQGVTGFLAAAGVVDLPDVTIHSSNEYGSVLLVSLDGAPIASSAKLLLQVTSEERPFGWTTDQPAGQRVITSAGAPPLMVRNLAGSVRLKRSDAEGLRVSTLDANGYRLGMPERHGAGITLQTNQFYYLLEN